MISVVTYGRNDNYGFNLYKRTAFGFNCLAEVLTEEDEVLFVDYNTPGHLPTLPEFIWDTLTEKALKLIKVIRIAPEVHDSIKQDSPLKILENVSRNAAIVRSNPKNYWVLSTNPDVLLVLASKWSSLTDLLRDQPDSFYEMPRFDIPESVWSALPRSEPQDNLHLLRDWLVHHKAAIPETVPDYRFQKFLLFDAPGDFQLAPREYFFRLRGFDESMNKYLHSDSNLAKRMWLLNGERTDHLLGHLWVLHQDHYLSGEWAKNVGTIVHNDYHTKVDLQSALEANDDKWGLQDLRLPTFSLAEKIRQGRRFFPPLPQPVNGDLPLSREPDWSMEPLYRLCHYSPEVLALYVRELLQIVRPESLVVYLGDNAVSFEQLSRAWEEVSPGGAPVEDFCASPAGSDTLTPDVLLVDCYYERSEYWENRIRMLREQMQYQLAKGRIQPREVEQEVSRFADNADENQLHRRLTLLWKMHLGRLRMRPGSHIVLIGCNLYCRHFFTFQEAFATHCVGLESRQNWLQKLHSRYQRLKVRMQVEEEHNFVLKVLWLIRMMKRRAFRSLTGHESLMGYIYLKQFLRYRDRLLKPLNLRTLYVHHRLVVMRVES